MGPCNEQFSYTGYLREEWNIRIGLHSCRRWKKTSRRCRSSHSPKHYYRQKRQERGRFRTSAWPCYLWRPT